jgi:hypothetical protein
MSFSIRQLLVAVAYVGFAITALRNIDYPLFATVVEWLVIGTLLSSAYRSWADKGEARCFHAGFVIAVVLYLITVGILAQRLRYQAPPYIFGPVRDLLLPPGIASIPWVSDTFERAAHFLASLVVGLFCAWLTAFLYRERLRTLGWIRRIIVPSG